MTRTIEEDIGIQRTAVVSFITGTPQPPRTSSFTGP